MRELRTVERVLASGKTEDHIRWALKTGRWTHVAHGVVGRGSEPPSALDKARATALITGGVCHGLVAGELHRFDNVYAGEPEVLVSRNFSGRRSGVTRTIAMPSAARVGQVRCTHPADTLLELASRLDDDHWEQALEFCLRKRHVTREQLAEWAMTDRRIRRVVKARGAIDVPHTDSLLETLAIQLIRLAGLPPPVRQYEVRDPKSGRIVARCDLAWPELGIFLELDGQHHADQPVYDARRQTLVTAITGWRCARMTWDDVVGKPAWCAEQLAALLLCAGSLVS